MKHLLIALFALTLFAQTDTQPDPPNSITVAHRTHPTPGTTIKLFVEEHGKCAFDTKNGSDYAKAQHYSDGKVYGFWIHPKKKPDEVVRPPRRVLWLCRYHIAEMTGTDPETGEAPAWDTRIK